ncbi:MAG: bifunctional diaminohydroxyphosphoribosylaminopyrimidine deaminase/5-amino-6-(5-phosphoribosylamino)uracil reductase RibD [Armatimonadetes bacterium]|nr:bifunctional diaminohydroxyphosphoribosylaminopyrimidine deaminase/5-amino-6-(5-phosphoribosylamino)uracil reductase RibD [Armatimonadota bacterium]
MKRALELAERGLGRTCPNPAVGAVVVADDQIAGEGFHRAAGQPHAEILALEDAGQRAAGAELYVTLEPCSTEGRTPPCTDAIIAADISRVVYACEDCDPANTGRAAEILAAAGIETLAGPLEQEARQLNEAFFKHKSTGYPFVTAKLACTLDGKIATRSGDARWITGKEAREFVHILRDRSDAVMVGRGTVAADDPSLTTRTDRPDSRDAVRVVVDTRAQTPPTAQVFSVESDAPCLIAVAGPEVDGDEAQKRVAKLQQAGAEIVLVSEEEGRVDLRELMRQLGSRDIMSVLIEGGSQLVGGLLQEGLVDKLFLFYAPKILADDQALSAISGMKAESISDARGVRIHSVEQIGADILVTAYLCSPD